MRAVSVVDSRGANAIGPKNFGQAEIENLRVSALGDEDVRWLHIAMDNAGGVSRVQCVGDFDSDRQQSLSFERTARNAVLQRHPVQKFHGDERLIIVFADFVDRADVGMVQCRRRPGFKAEAF